MRKIEIMVACSKEELVMEFDSIRSAHDFAVKCIDYSSPPILMSRIWIGENIIHNKWLLFGACGIRRKVFLIRYKPTHHANKLELPEQSVQLERISNE